MTQPIPTHLREYAWYAPHQAWLRDEGLPHHDPGDASPKRADLRFSDLRGADLEGATFQDAEVRERATVEREPDGYRVMVGDHWAYAEPGAEVEMWRGRGYDVKPVYLDTPPKPTWPEPAETPAEAEARKLDGEGFYPVRVDGGWALSHRSVDALRKLQEES